MRIVALAVAATMAAMLSGCDTAQFTGGSGKSGPPRALKSTKKDCLEITPVTACIVAVDPSQTKWVDDVIVIHGMSDRTIEFQIKEGYVFTGDDGITVDAPETKYKCKLKPNEPRKVECKYKRDAFGVHKFTVNAKSGSTVLPPYDPYFINE